MVEFLELIAYAVIFSVAYVIVGVVINSIFNANSTIMNISISAIIVVLLYHRTLTAKKAVSQKSRLTPDIGHLLENP
jgi:hypothetical protein